MIIGRWLVFITTSTGLGILVHEAGLDGGLSVVQQVIVGSHARAGRRCGGLLGSP